MTVTAWAYAWVLNAVASNRIAALCPGRSRSARHTPGRGRGRYSIHRRAPSSVNGNCPRARRAASRGDSRWLPAAPPGAGAKGTRTEGNGEEGNHTPPPPVNRGGAGGGPRGGARRNPAP